MAETQNKSTTQYRIITLRTFIADRYLQFKSTKLVRCFPQFWRKREVECWRFIPQDNYAYVSGCYLGDQSCPTSLPFMEENCFLHSFYKQEWDLNSFARRYPDIQAYFSELRRKHSEYLAEERERFMAEKSREVTYINRSIISAD